MSVEFSTEVEFGTNLHATAPVEGFRGALAIKMCPAK